MYYKQCGKKTWIQFRNGSNAQSHHFTMLSLACALLTVEFKYEIDLVKLWHDVRNVALACADQTIQITLVTDGKTHPCTLCLQKK